MVRWASDLGMALGVGVAIGAGLATTQMKGDNFQAKKIVPLVGFFGGRWVDLEIDNQVSVI